MKPTYFNHSIREHVHPESQGGVVNDTGTVRLRAGESKVLDLRMLGHLKRRYFTLESQHPDFRECHVLRVDVRSIKARDKTSIFIVSSDWGEIRIFPAVERANRGRGLTVGCNSQSFYAYNGANYEIDTQQPFGLVDLAKEQYQETHFVYYPCDSTTVQSHVEVLFRSLMQLVWAGGSDKSIGYHIASVLNTIGIGNRLLKPMVLQAIGSCGLKMAQYATSQLQISHSPMGMSHARRTRCYFEWLFSQSILQLIVTYIDNLALRSFAGKSSSSLSLAHCEPFLHSLARGASSPVVDGVRKADMRPLGSGQMSPLWYQAPVEPLRSLPRLPRGLVVSTPSIAINTALLMGRVVSNGDSNRNMIEVVSCLKLLLGAQGNAKSRHDFLLLYSLYRDRGRLEAHDQNTRALSDIAEFLTARGHPDRRVVVLGSERHAAVLDFYVDAHRRTKLKVSNSGYVGWNNHAAYFYGIHLCANTVRGGRANKRCNSVICDISHFSGDKRLANSFVSELARAVATDNLNQFYDFLVRSGMVENSRYIQSMQKEEDCSIEALLSHAHDTVDHFESYLKMKAQLLVCSINTMAFLSPRDFANYIVAIREHDLASDVLKFYRQRCLSGYALTDKDMQRIAVAVTPTMFARLQSCIERIEQGANRRNLHE